MKGFLIVLATVGTISLIAGGACIAIGIHNNIQNEKVVENVHYIDDTFQNFSIDLEQANLEIKKATDDKVKVVCSDREKTYHEVSVSNNTLTIKQIDKRHWYEKYILNFGWWKNYDVTVYVPETTYGNLEAKASTGSLTLNKDFTFENAKLSSATGSVNVKANTTESLEVKCDTGSVTLEDMSAKNIKVNEHTGSVRLNRIEASGTVELHTSTGSIYTNTVNCEDLKARCSTGSINLKDTIANNSFELKASTGSIKFDRCDAGSIEATTSTGSIRGTLLSEKIFFAHSDTGSVRVPETMTGGRCKLESDTGSINIEIVA